MLRTKESKKNSGLIGEEKKSIENGRDKWINKMEIQVQYEA